MDHELTLSDIAKTLRSRGQRLALSHSSGQYHVYVFDQDVVKNYQRGDELDVTVELALKDPAEH